MRLCCRCLPELHARTTSFLLRTPAITDQFADAAQRSGEPGAAYCRIREPASLEALALKKQPGGLFLAKSVTDLLGHGTNGSSQAGMPTACFLAMDEPPPFDAPAGARRRDERRSAISEQSVKNMPVACFLAMDEPPPFDAPAGARRRDERRSAISEQSVKNMPVACFLAMEANHSFHPRTARKYE